MKKIKFIPLLLIAFSLIVTSCAIDDDDPVVGTDIVTKTVSLMDDADIIVAKSDTPHNIGLLVDLAFSTNSLVEYTVNGSEGGAATIHFGDTSGNISVNVSTPGEYIITLSNVSVLDKPSYVDAVIDDSKKVVKITVLDVEVDPNALQIILDWDNPSQNDLDLYVTDDDPVTVWYERSWTVTPQETISFATSYPDDTYNISPNIWESADNDVNISLFLIHPNGVIEFFNGTINDTVDGNYYYFVKFEKVGNQFTTTQVPIESIF